MLFNLKYKSYKSLIFKLVSNIETCKNLNHYFWNSIDAPKQKAYVAVANCSVTILKSISFKKNWGLYSCQTYTNVYALHLLNVIKSPSHISEFHSNDELKKTW